MKGDFSRLTFHRRRHYSSVRLQQGRADVVEGGVHLLGVELAPRPELSEDRVETAAQRIEHLPGFYGPGRRAPLDR